MSEEETLDLFPGAHAESPRLAWLREHDLIVREYQHPHSLNGSQRWMCANRAMTRYASAETQQQAELAYALRYDIANYQIAGYDAATGSDTGVTALARVIPGEAPKVVILEMKLEGHTGIA